MKAIQVEKFGGPERLMLADVSKPRPGLGEVLVRLPAGGRHPGMHAGPSFVVGTLHPLPFKSAAWYVMKERFGELKDYTDQLVADNSEVSQRLKPVASTLGRISRLLG